MAAVNKVVRKKAESENELVRWQLVYFRLVEVNGKVVRKRFRKNFNSKADATAARIKIENVISMESGEAIRDDGTLLELALIWIDHFEMLVRKGARERSTLEPYKQHINVHMKPTQIAQTKLSELSVPKCQIFLDNLAKNASLNMTRRVKATLTQVLGFGVKRGYVRKNYFEDTSAPETGDRHDDELYVPDPADVHGLIAAAKKLDLSGELEAMVRILATTGIRISELLGFPVKNLIELSGNAPKMKIDQRADRWGKIGKCKTKNSKRLLPVPRSTADAIQRWLANRPKTSSDLLFPNGAGRPESYSNIRNRIWIPLLRELKMTRLAPPVRNRKLKPYCGLGNFEVWGPYSSVTEQSKFSIHDLRHFYASFNIKGNMAPKRLQKLMGHALLSTTMDTYGNLWDDPEGDEAIANSLDQQFP